MQESNGTLCISETRSVLCCVKHESQIQMEGIGRCGHELRTAFHPFRRELESDIGGIQRPVLRHTILGISRGDSIMMSPAGLPSVLAAERKRSDARRHVRQANWRRNRTVKGRTPFLPHRMGI